MTGLNLKSKDAMRVGHGLTKEQSNKIYEEYQLLFRDRGKKAVDLTTSNGCEKFITRIYRNMFGEEICTAKRKQKGKIKYTEYSFNWDKLYKHRDISTYKNPALNREALDLTFGKESGLISYNQPQYLFTLVLEEIQEQEGKKL